MYDIATQLAEVNAQIAQLSQAVGRTEGSVQLVAVSKTKPAALIAEAFAAGQRDFGENYVQEAVAKIEELKKLAITWHFLGPIQTNKTAAIAHHFHWVHSVDRLKVAERLSKQRPAELPPLQVCLQVNIDASPSKSGCSTEEALSLAKAIAALPNIQLRGLMTVPAPGTGKAPFTALNALLHSINEHTGFKLDTLSMGMSGDMADAIACGATLVRIGTAIFGARPHPAG